MICGGLHHVGADAAGGLAAVCHLEHVVTDNTGARVHGDGETELLLELADQSSLGALPCVDLPAGEAPAQGEVSGAGSLLQQDEELQAEPEDEHALDDLHAVVRHR